MRENIKSYLFDLGKYPDHAISSQYQRISNILDQFPQLLKYVAADLACNNKTYSVAGAKGMSTEQILRAAILMRVEDLTYRELDFKLIDSQSSRIFVRLLPTEHYKYQALQYNISRITASTWQIVNKTLVKYAQKNKIENGKTVRVDSTVVESNIHHPTDSQLLFDCIIVFERIYNYLNFQFPGTIKKTRFNKKSAKKLVIAIMNAKNDEDRKPIYADLLVGCGDIYEQIEEILAMSPLFLEESKKSTLKYIDRLKLLYRQMNRVINQTLDRVIDGKQVPVSEKIVSIYEEHTDIIVKDRRETYFGHKVFLTTGKSNIVLDCVVTEGNPTDSKMFISLIERLKEIQGKFPKSTAADGGFCSRENLAKAKELGIESVAFSKKCGLEIKDMVKSVSIFKKLKDFRAGIESNISALKRGFGLSRSLWSTWEGFCSYVWSGVVSYNLFLLGKA